MKKTLALLLVFLAATSVQAASIDWSLSGKNQVLSEYGGGTASKTPVYLILADSASLASITDVVGETAFKDALSLITVATLEAGSDGKKPAGLVNNTVTVASDKITAGQSYNMAMIYVSVDTDGNGWYKMASGLGVAYDPSVEGSSGLVSTDWGTMRSSSWTKGYSPVPEPSTAVLALAGLALLLKRRRA